MTILIIVLIVIAYACLHGHHYRKHRRAGLTIRQSIPGPFGSWISISKRFRG
jgi:hypothetical protein